MQKLARVGIAVVVVAGVIGLKFYDKGNAEAEIKTGMHDWIASAAGYSDDPAYAEALFEKHHGPAFEKAYDVGGRRRSASFDDGHYMAEVTTAMALDARVDGREKLAAGLEEMRRRYDAAPR